MWKMRKDVGSSAFRFQISDPIFQIPDFQIPELGFQIPGSRSQMSNSRFQISYSRLVVMKNIFWWLSRDAKITARRPSQLNVRVVGSRLRPRLAKSKSNNILHFHPHRRCPDFRSQIPDPIFQIPDSRSRIPDSGFQISDCRFHNSESAFQNPDPRFHIPE